MSENNIFIKKEIYPNNIFGIINQPIAEIKDECIFVLDTNALLLPYITSTRSLQEIEKVYTGLINQHRLLVPDQVVREFASNRPDKLKDIFQKLSKKRNSNYDFQIGSYPLLEDFEEYQEHKLIENELNKLIVKYRQKLGELVDKVKGWNWNDPISLLYRKLFKDDVVYEYDFDKKIVEDELKRRYDYKIPPGYKDEGKADKGIGDLLIWFTILDIAKKEQKNVVFVSGDEKSDWFHKSEGLGLYPRFELINEFNVSSNGKSFHIIKLSDLLDLFGADEFVVNEIKEEEQINVKAEGVVAKNYRKHRDANNVFIIEWIIAVIMQDNSTLLEEVNNWVDYIVENQDEKIAIEYIPLITNKELYKKRVMKFLSKIQTNSILDSVDKILVVTTAINDNYLSKVDGLFSEAISIMDKEVVSKVSLIKGIIDNNVFVVK